MRSSKVLSLLSHLKRVSVGGNGFLPRELATVRYNSSSSKPPSDLDKELEKLNEKLKKDFDAEINKGAEEVEKNFMNFKQESERQAYKRSMIFNWKIAAATLAIGGSCLAALLYIRKIRIDDREKQRKLTAGKARIGGDWELLNTEGKLVKSEELKGNWLLLYFGFTHCPDICPDEIEKMIQVVNALDSDKKDPIPIVPVFISVDPARDTVARVKEYCSEFSSKLQGFTGSLEQVGKVAKTFRVYHSQGPKTADDDYIVDHTVIMYLIDPEGNFHDYYGQNRKAEEIVNIIKMKVLKHQMQAKKGVFGF